MNNHCWDEIDISEENIRNIMGGKDFETYYYKQLENENLKLLVNKPEGWRPDDRRTAIVWIHGGGWCGGEMEYFNPHCRLFAMKGTVNFNVQYRLMDSKVLDKGRTIISCLKDCKSAIRYIRKNSGVFGIDQDKIVAVGDSAGGHLACCLGTLKGFDSGDDDTSISDMVNAVVNCNGIVDLTTKWKEFVPVRQEGTNSDEKVTVEKWMQHRKLARDLSPIFNIRPGQPPMLILHGLNDTVADPEYSVRCYEKYINKGNQAELILYPSFSHAFVLFNYQEKSENVLRVVKDIDSWLQKIEFL